MTSDARAAELLRQVLDALPGAVLVLDADWTVTAANAAAATGLGGPPAGLVGSTVWDAVPGLRDSLFDAFLRHARTAGRRVTWTGYLSPAARWVEASALRTGDLLVVGVRDAQPGTGTAPAGGDDPERDRLQLLASVSEAMSSTRDVEEALERLLELVVPRLCDWALVTLLDDTGALGEPARAHRDPALLPDLDTYLAGRDRGLRDEELVAAAVGSGEPVHADEVDTASVAALLQGDEVRRAWWRLDAASYTVVPLRTREHTFGALTLVNASTRRPHDEAEIAAAVEVARRAALALDNARLYARQQQVADILQRSLLAPSPAPPGLELAVRHRPAGGHLQVGGDWYDAFAQPDGAALLVIGDVVGHNVHAAAAMGQVRSLLRGIAYDRPESPAQLLGRLDELLAGLQLTTMATALVARLEPPGGDDAGRVLRWSSAGHLPPMVRRRDGAVEQLRADNGTLLGVGSTTPRPEAATGLRPGDTVLLYTDGLVEHGRPGIDEGLARLAAALRRVGALPVEELCDALLAEIVGEQPEDDVAVLAVRWGAGGGSGGGEVPALGTGAGERGEG